MPFTGAALQFDGKQRLENKQRDSAHGAPEKLTVSASRRSVAAVDTRRGMGVNYRLRETLREFRPA